MEDNKIIQIMPCGEMYAVFKEPVGENGEVEFFKSRVVFLALLESLRDETDRWVAGFISDGSYFSNPEDEKNFHHYQFGDDE
jgi:hypothetical protein